jgi:toxin ParE1/3/4
MALGSERGHRRDDVRPGLRIVGFERRITIAFTVSAEDVTILRIFYAGRNWEDEL